VSEHVTKAVIPAAGLGTRLGPLTTHIPKELLPVGEKPMIQYTLEMYVASGISEVCIITSPQKRLIMDFVTGNWLPPALPFSKDGLFYRKLEACRTVFLTQEKPRGVADAIALARDFVGNEPFACIMPDCLLFSDKPMAAQLIRGFDRCKTNVIGTIFLRGNHMLRFGNVGVLEKDEADHDCPTITSLSGKKKEPLSAKPGGTICKGFGGGIYLPEYFDLIETMRPHATEEVDDVPVHQILAEEGKLVGVPLEGTAFDAGHSLGFRAAVHFAGRPGS
jgi:UTP--glucose-1-phosphate uridylyltransferase